MAQTIAMQEYSCRSNAEIGWNVAYSVDLFPRMLMIGIAVAAPVGAMALLTIQRTVAFGWRTGLATGLGIATADAAFAAVAAFGVAAISTVLIDYQGLLRLVGGFGLLWLAWRAFRSQAVPHSQDLPTAPPHGRSFTVAFGLTLTNPMTIMAFAAIFAGAGLVVEPGASQALVATIGVALGSLLWWIALVGIVAALRHAISGNALQWINRISGIALALFGILAIASGLTSGTLTP
jgi:putative LysE/RhtB family amino acid efflux pump